MSKYYNPQRTRNLYDPKSSGSFKLSRSKIDLFLNCPRCFYLDRRLGIGQPPGFPFSLNSAVDALLKKEFDYYRLKHKIHPLVKEAGLKLYPIQHEKLDEWRENFKGIEYLEPTTNLIITGAIDDLWTDKEGRVYVVDYKSTSKDGEVNLEADWQIGYKRQMEVYQWLLRRNGLMVSDIGYFVYCNGLTDRETFNARLDFSIKLLSYKGNDAWVERAIKEASDCLNSDDIPEPNSDCDYCRYREAVNEVL